MDVRVGLWRRLSAEELMLLNYVVGEDSWESLGLQGDPTSPFWRRSGKCLDGQGEGGCGVKERVDGLPVTELFRTFSLGNEFWNYKMPAAIDPDRAIYRRRGNGCRINSWIPGIGYTYILLIRRETWQGFLEWFGVGNAPLCHTSRNGCK